MERNSSDRIDKDWNTMINYVSLFCFFSAAVMALGGINLVMSSDRLSKDGGRELFGAFLAAVAGFGVQMVKR